MKSGEVVMLSVPVAFILYSHSIPESIVSPFSLSFCRVPNFDFGARLRIAKYIFGAFFDQQTTPQ